MNVVPSGLLGYPDSALALLFPADLRGFPGDTGPRSLAIPGSSSRQLRALSRVWCYLGPVNRPQPINSFPGVCSSFTTSVPRVHFSASIPSRLRSAHSVSHTLDGLLLSVPGGPISSHTPCARFALQGLSPTLSRPGSSPTRPLLTF